MSTIDTHPYQVGSVVYRTAAAAIAAAERALDVYPRSFITVLDRRTSEVIWDTGDAIHTPRGAES